MRRVLQNIGVTYETTADQMQQAVASIRGILESDEKVGQDFMVIRFNDFGSSSLDIQLIYFIKELAYADFMEKKEQINLAIMRALENLGLSIAFPTRTIYMHGDAAENAAGTADDKADTLGGGRRKK
jgi:MscS family membrane protein